MSRYHPFRYQQGNLLSAQWRGGLYCGNVSWHTAIKTFEKYAKLVELQPRPYDQTHRFSFLGKVAFRIICINDFSL